MTKRKDVWKRFRWIDVLTWRREYYGINYYHEIYAEKITAIRVGLGFLVFLTALAVIAVFAAQANIQTSKCW